MKRSLTSGFTLLEILVVLVIMGLMAGAVVMIGGDNRAEIARDEIERLNAKIRLALEEAQLQGVEFGLVVTETDYRFVTFGKDRWTVISDDRAYERHRLPKGFELGLEIEGFKLAGARLPGARITEEGVVVTDGDSERDSKKAKADTQEKSDESRGQAGEDLTNESSATETSSGEKPGAAKPVDGKEPKTLLPQVFLLSSGELNPFVLAIGNRDNNPVFFRLRANADGDLRIEGPIQADLVDDLTVPWDNPDPNAIPVEEDSFDKSKPTKSSTAAKTTQSGKPRNEPN